MTRTQPHMCNCAAATPETPTLSCQPSFPRADAATQQIPAHLHARGERAPAKPCTEPAIGPRTELAAGPAQDQQLGLCLVLLGEARLKGEGTRVLTRLPGDQQQDRICRCPLQVWVLAAEAMGRQPQTLLPCVGSTGEGRDGAGRRAVQAGQAQRGEGRMGQAAFMGQGLGDKASHTVSLCSTHGWLPMPTSRPPNPAQPCQHSPGMHTAPKNRQHSYFRVPTATRPPWTGWASRPGKHAPSSPSRGGPAFP